jgi:hypothetical protein
MTCRFWSRTNDRKRPASDTWASSSVCFGVGQATDAAIHTRQEEVAVDRHQDRARVRRPLIVGDPLGAGDAEAFAAHLLFFGDFGAAAELQRIDQHAGLAGGGVHRPQVEAVAILRPVAQQGGDPPVRRKLERARRRTGERWALKEPLEGEIRAWAAVERAARVTASMYEERIAAF